MADLTVHRYDYVMPGDLADFDVKDYVGGALKWIAGLVEPKEKVALSASGGVDSTTVAFLLREALGERLHPFFIDDGLRRVIGGREEWEVTAEMFEDFPNFQVLRTRDTVLPAFEGVEDGTKKREMFRDLYTQTSNKHIAAIEADWIADGTIAPDIVMTDQNRQIQHNVNLPYNMKKLEAFSALYKPHVRRVAVHLGIPRDFAMRIPCPGPAQLLRVGGPFSEEKLQISKLATDIVEKRVCAHANQVWGKPYRYDEATGVRTPFQYFATCLDPGMMLDLNLSEFVKGFLGNEAECFAMQTKAMWIDPKVESQERKLYAPILWVVGPKVDYEQLAKLYAGLCADSGLPRVLYEVFDSGAKGYPVGIKIVGSEDVRTAWPMNVPFDELVNMGEEICERTGAAKAAYDISKRPPATIELF
jgi:GMP synthase (glutamine-hydrolysing) B subunit